MSKPAVSSSRHSWSRHSRLAPILAGLALAALGGTALAADLPARTGPIAAPVYAPMFTWTGFYVGAHAGGIFSNSDIRTQGTAANTITNVAIFARPPTIGTDEGGIMGGVQVGYNYQMGNWVFGVESDIAYTDLKKQASYIGSTGATATFRQDLDYLGTVRLRAGYAFDRLLVYGTGGLAYGDVTNRATFFSAAVPGQIDYIGSKSDVRFGWTVGGGVEYAFTDNLSVKAEYLYYDLGKRSVPVALTAAGPAGGSYVSKFDNTGHVARVGLNYRFATW